MKFLLILLLFSTTAFGKAPTRNNLRQATVKILNNKLNSGGSGAIIKSTSTQSIVLTNSHVCQVVENGGYVTQNNVPHRVHSYKKFPGHDLCLVRVKKNLGVNTPISPTMPNINDSSIVSGHPNLLPNVINSGHFSDQMKIRVVTDFAPCFEEEMLTSFECAFFGNKAVFTTYDSQLITNLIQAGNSGSAVYNLRGQISGVVFAGSGDISYGFIVPHMYVTYFLLTEKQIPWVSPSKKARTNKSGIKSAKEKCTQTVKYPNKRVRDICKTISRDVLVRN